MFTAKETLTDTWTYYYFTEVHTHEVGSWSVVHTLAVGDNPSVTGEEFVVQFWRKRVSSYEYPVGKPFCDFIETMFKPQLLRPKHVMAQNVETEYGLGYSRIYFLSKPNGDGLVQMDPFHLVTQSGNYRNAMSRNIQSDDVFRMDEVSLAFQNQLPNYKGLHCKNILYITFYKGRNYCPRQSLPLHL